MMNLIGKWIRNTEKNRPPDNEEVLAWVNGDYSLLRRRKSGWPQEYHWVACFGGHFAEDDEVTYWGYVQAPIKAEETE